MITSIFSKSKPINFVIVFFITLLAFITANVKPIKESVSITSFLGQTAIFFICYLSILLFNFIVRKNSLTKNNDYQILLFGLFFLILSQTTGNENMLLANFFVLLGLRRIISLRTQINIKKKLFDAAFWFAIAALFYFWVILFFILIFSTLLLYIDNRMKNWIIPIAGLATVFIIAISTSVIFYDNFFEIFNISFGVSYNYSAYNSPVYLVAITILFSFGVWSSIFYLKNFKKKKKALRPSFKIVFIALVIALIISVSVPQKNGSEFVFMFAPLSIIITNYIETIEEKWFKELFLFVLIVVPFVLLML